jgi:hypothetical protein
MDWMDMLDGYGQVRLLATGRSKFRVRLQLTTVENGTVLAGVHTE